MTYSKFNSLLLLIPLTLYSSVGYVQTSAGSDIDEKGLNQSTLESFCKEKTIWQFFDITVENCLGAATTCAEEDVFKNIDPTTLSEAFYHCVFKKLDIEIE
ncbi:MAG: hypothetical protein ACRBCI_01225 [Cellvibrionaceae bacterium]